MTCGCGRRLNFAIDRQALNEQQTLGASPPTANIVPRAFEFALPIEAYPYDPEKAKQLLKEAGYPNGFDAGEITSGPPYHALAEGIANYLQAVGIRIKVRPMERAALIAALKEKKLTGLTSSGSGTLGNAATRLGALCRELGGICQDQLPRYRRAVQTAIGGTGPQETRGAAASNPAARARARHVRPAL